MRTCVDQPTAMMDAHAATHRLVAQRRVQIGAPHGVTDRAVIEHPPVGTVPRCLPVQL